MPIISPHRHCVSSANTSVQTGSQASPSPKETAAGLDLWAGTQCVYRRWAGITEVRKNCLPCSLVPRRIEITRYWLEGSFKNFIINLTCLELNSLQHTYLQSYFSSQKIASPRCLSQKPKRQAYFFSSPHLCITLPENPADGTSPALLIPSAVEIGQRCPLCISLKLNTLLCP